MQPFDLSQPVAPQLQARKAHLLAPLLIPRARPQLAKQLMQELAALVDGLLTQLWDASGMNQALQGQCALVAVGGFGRGELQPYSDVDMMVLLPNAHGLNTPDSADASKVATTPQLPTTAAAAIERFISQCWDAGLEMGTSTRTVEDCLAQAHADVSVQTALLESRLITGDARLFDAFKSQFEAQLDPLAFLHAKRAELHQRHTRYENTPYSLEPNCKESPGGLRDLHVLLWLAKAAGLGHTWDDLVTANLATPYEAAQIKRNEAVLNLVRAKLHWVAKRREDRLVFDLQHAVAQSFGFEAKDGRRASEFLMRRYYWAAKAVTQLHQILLQGIEAHLMAHKPARQQLDDYFDDVGGLIDVRGEDTFLHHPEQILRTFLLYQTTAGITGLSAKTLRALYNARPVMDARFRDDEANRHTFLQIMQAPEGITHSLRLMNQTSVLGRYLWVFRRIVGQMQHDLFHVYTVDQHILMVLRNVRRFFIPEHGHEYPFCSQLAAGWDKPWLLYIAALFHDIAKGRGGDHSELGAVEARRFCKQHGISTVDADLIVFLVKEHLSLSSTAQKEDLSDPQVIQNLVQKVGTERYLTALYLLTVADIRGTSPKVWNAWKAKLLEDAYRLTLRALGGRAPDRDAEIEAKKRDAQVLLAQWSEPHEAHLPLWQTLDVGYFVRHDAADIAWHAKHLSRHVVRGEGTLAAPIVRVRASPVGEGLQVLVYTPDQADLFARICGYFDQAGFSIWDAKIHTAKNGFALDTFQVVTASLPEHYRELISMVESSLTVVLERQLQLPAPSQGRLSRRVKHFPMPPSIHLQPDEQGTRWLLTVNASDQTGLLYRIARILTHHQLSIQLAKVTTLGERVEDTFVIEGAAFARQKTQIDIETDLLHALQ